jgi:hypothetical protein
MSDTVVYGTGVFCVGCGRFFGLGCVVITDEVVGPPETWPFPQDDCPVCLLRDALNVARDRIATLEHDTRGKKRPLP